MLFRSFCVGQDSPTLRVSVSTGSHTNYVHNRIVTLKDHFVDGDLRFMQGNKTVFTAHMECLDPPTESNDSLIQPPPDARPIEVNIAVADSSVRRMPVLVAAGTAQGILIMKVAAFL